MAFLMIDGSGDPNTSEDYKDAIETLYAVAYTIKFSSKNELGKDYVAPPLEGLWSAEDMSAFQRRANPSRNPPERCWQVTARLARTAVAPYAATERLGVRRR